MRRQDCRARHSIPHRLSRCAVFLVLAASVYLPRIARAGEDVLNVPFIAQKTNYCGPAALAMLANYYGHPVSQDDIASAIYLPDIGGTVTSELGEYARRFHLWVRQYHGSVDDLREKLGAGVPLLVLGRFGEHPHYFVVLGWDNFRQVVTVHSDARARFEMRVEDFRRYWDHMGNWTLLVCPPEKATWHLSAEEHNDLGVFLERAGEFESATRQYIAATRMRPENSYFQMNLGNALLKLHRLDEAAKAFARAIALDGQNADAMNNLAYTDCEMGRNLEEAVTLCHRAATVLPARKAYFLDTLGTVYLKQGKRPEAVAAFESALAGASDRDGSLRAAIQQRLAAAEKP
ncbi:MAG TPA: PA2778 family cysteine peptidase [Verrucomicrobiae bacterium]|nr:PA2778 family cysteine peptidase [Verrucomicrobiae bacterium]